MSQESVTDWLKRQLQPSTPPFSNPPASDSGVIDRISSAFRSIAGRKVALSTFDTAYYGYDLNFPLEVPGLTAQAITFSTATFGRSADEDFSPTSSSTAYKPLLHSLDRLVSNTDSGFVLHEGNNTAFNHDYIIHADMTAVLHQVQLSFAVCENVSAFTSGSVNLDAVTLQMRSYEGAARPSPFSSGAAKRISPESAFTALTATGTQIMVVRTTLDTPDILYQDQPLTVNITINETTSGTNTRQVGIVPLFPLFATNGPRMLYESEMIAHVHPIPAHTDELIPFLRSGGWRLTSQG